MRALAASRRDEVAAPHQHEREHRANERDDKPTSSTSFIADANALWIAAVATGRNWCGVEAITCWAPPTATAFESAAAWPAAGVWASAGASLFLSALSKIAPSPAIPVAIPTWRKVLLIPIAIPLRCGGTTPIAVAASAGLTNPTPAPARRNPASNAVQCEVAFRPRIRSSAPARPAPVPVPSSRRTGTRAVSRPEAGGDEE